MGDANYSKEIDIWALGCIFAELSNGLPLYPGESDLNTLELILKTMNSSLTDK